jgi:hypothetical protein
MSDESSTTVTSEEAVPPSVETLVIPSPLQNIGNLENAMRQLAKVPKEVSSGVPADVFRTAVLDLNAGEKPSNRNEWRSRLYFIDGWYVCWVVADRMSTIEQVHEAGQLDEEDYQILTLAVSKYTEANGTFQAEVPREDYDNIRLALGNVNRAILGERRVSRQMRDDKRATDAAKRLADATERQQQRATKHQERQQSSAGDTNRRDDQPRPKQVGEAQQRPSRRPNRPNRRSGKEQLLELLRAWKDFDFEGTPANRQALEAALQALEGSALYDDIRADLNCRPVR